MVTRAEFCSRLMPALRLAAKQGYIRNDARTRGLLGYDTGPQGSKHFGNRLCAYRSEGLLIATNGGVVKGRACFYRITNRGRTAIDTNGRHSHRNTVSYRLGAYIKANTDEELTHEDIAIKFGCTHLQARRAVEYLVNVGICERVRVVRAARVREPLKSAAEVA
jgi:response regulator of citrate/malate metabolism